MLPVEPPATREEAAGGAGASGGEGGAAAARAAGSAAAAAPSAASASLGSLDLLSPRASAPRVDLDTESYFLAGALCALAVFNGVVLDVRFPLAL
jgi:hypothetical protein